MPLLAPDELPERHRPLAWHQPQPERDAHEVQSVELLHGSLGVLAVWHVPVLTLHVSPEPVQHCELLVHRSPEPPQQCPPTHSPRPQQPALAVQLTPGAPQHTVTPGRLAMLPHCRPPLQQLGAAAPLVHVAVAPSEQLVEGA